MTDTPTLLTQRLDQIAQTETRLEELDALRAEKAALRVRLGEMGGVWGG